MGPPVRAAKRTPWAALQIACDLVDEGVLDEAAALATLGSLDLDRITRGRIDQGTAPDPIGRATPASTGVAAGLITLEADTARLSAERGDPVILVREDASTDDIAAFPVCRGLLTSRGARTSHAAVVARQLGIVCLVNCGDLAVDVADACRSDR